MMYYIRDGIVKPVEVTEEGGHLSTPSLPPLSAVFFFFCSVVSIVSPVVSPLLRIRTREKNALVLSVSFPDSTLTE